MRDDNGMGTMGIKSSDVCEVNVKINEHDKSKKCLWNNP